MSQEAYDIDELLAAWAAGDKSALGRLMKAAYSDLHQLATTRLGRESAETSLQPDELLNELFLHLASKKPIPWENRSQFLHAAALLMRRLLVDHARRRQSQRSPPTLAELDDLATRPSGNEVDFLSLEQALAELAEIDPRASKVVELRFFAGLSLYEVGETLGVSRPTVERDWKMAKTWLSRKLMTAPAEERSDTEISNALHEFAKSLEEASQQLMKLEARIDAALGEPYA